MTKSEIYNAIKEAWGENNEKKYLKLLQGLENDIRAETAKAQGGKTSDITIIKRILRGCDADERIGYHALDFNNKQYFMFTQGHTAVGSTINYGYDPCKISLDFDRIIKSECFEQHKIKVDINDLKAFLKLNKPVKDKQVTPYIIEDDFIKIAFNPRYLLDVLSFCNTDVISVSKPLSPCFCCSDNMDKIGLCLPVRLKK